MKLRLTTLLIAFALLLTACNFTLAADVTPPPGYVPPTAMPTLGPLYPAAAPDYQNGAKIYVEKCAPCHGTAGLGDGEQGKQLPVTVAAIGLPDLAQKASPAAWYMLVTQGNVQRFMPPFVSLNDQERWDVVSYALMLHMAPDQIQKGKSLLESSCADCAKKFSDPEKMFALSELDLIKIIKNGEGDIPAFGKDFTDEEVAAVAMYLRTLTFAAPAAAPTATSVPASTPTLAATPSTEVTASSESGTPSAEVTPGESTQIAATPNGTESATPQTTATAAVGSVSGTVENKTGVNLPSDVKVTLHGYEHGGDPNAGATEVVTLDGTLNADGTYRFENVEIPENRIFLAEIKTKETAYQSTYAIVKAGMTEVTLPPIVMYATTEDFSGLKVSSLQIFFDFATQGQTQIFTVYTIVNDTDKTVVVKMPADQVIPFVAFAQGANKLGYQASQDSAPFVPADNGGFSMPPNKTPYGLVAFASIQKTKDIPILQPVLLAVDKVSVFLPEGMLADGKTLTDEGIQQVQGTNFHVYTSGRVEKNTSIEFTVTGEPKTTAVNPDITQNKNLLIGAGAFGLVLILLGVWLIMHDRNKDSEEEESGEETGGGFEDPESAMDAIIALDDLHRAGKISDEAYKQRREELKNALKKKP